MRIMRVSLRNAHQERKPTVMSEMCEEVTMFICKHPGMVACDVKFTEKTNFDGTPYWVAMKEITHILGSEIHDCFIEGFGRTKEIALERMKKNEDEFYESLWY